MIKIAITAEAFEAIARTLPGASVSATVAPHFLRAREGTQGPNNKEKPKQ